MRQDRAESTVLIDHNPISASHAVYVDILNSETSRAYDRETNRSFYILKCSAISILLILRFFSCFMRFASTAEFFVLCLQMPLLNKTEGEWKKIVPIAFGLLFFATDVFVTIRSTKKSLIPIFLSAHWKKDFLSFLSAMRQGPYPKKMIIPALSAMFGSAAKGDSAISMTFPMVENVAYIGSPIKFIQTPFSYLTGSGSALCFLCFQIFDKAFFASRVRHHLSLNPDWAAFQKYNRFSIRRKSIEGFLLATGGGLFSAVAVFYHNGHFSFSISGLLFFLFVAIGGIVFNYNYSYTEIHKIDFFKSIHNKQNCDQCELDSAQQKKLIDKMTRPIGVISACGDGITYSLAVIRTMQVIFHIVSLTSHDDVWRTTGDNPWALFSAFIVSLSLSIPAGMQGFSMWTSGLYSTKKPKPAMTVIEERNESSVAINS